MKKRWNALCALAVLAGFLLPVAAFADQTFSQLIIFGGVSTDVGNFASVHGSLPPPWFPGRTTNGPNVADYFAEVLNFPNEPSLHLVGPVVGNNFAVREALAGGHRPQDLPAQVQAYLDSRGGRADPQALHLLFLGESDVIDAFLEPNDGKSSQLIDAAVDGMENAIKTLVAAGAETIYAPNFTDLGSSPPAIQNHEQERATRLSVEYNTKFGKMLDRVEREVHFNLIRWDLFAFSHQFNAHVHELGFTTTTQGCLDLSPSGQCGDLAKFEWLKTFFPTTRVDRFVVIAMTQNLIEHEKERCRHEDLVPGNHITMMSQPHVGHAADKINSCLLKGTEQ